jgi:hypothetical protein
VIPVPAAASFIESWSHSLSSSFIIRAKVVRQLSFQSPMTLHAGMLRWSSLESGERERRFAASSPPSIYIMSFARARAPMVGWLAVRALGPTTPSVRRRLLLDTSLGERHSLRAQTRDARAHFLFQYRLIFRDFVFALCTHQPSASATDAKNQSLDGRRLPRRTWLAEEQSKSGLPDE